MAPASAASNRLPLLYRLFFLYIEPVATLVGAYFAHFRQNDYLSMTALSPTLLGPGRVESIVLTQLANMYMVFALNEALVLRATTNRDVWRTVLIGLLIADFGHIYSVRSMGLEIYWRFWDWNAMYWGNLGFVYIGATLRILFLTNVGSASRATAKRNV